MSTTQQQPPGWYTDPEPDPAWPGRIRYWDGEQWTEHRANPKPGVTCWRCGNDRPAGPAWCQTCQAPEVAPPGRHQTYRGVLSVPHPLPQPRPVVLPKAVSRLGIERIRPAGGGKRDRVIIGMICAGVLAVGLILFAASGDSTPAGAPDVHAQIRALRDCAELQATFDRNMDRTEARRPGDPIRDATFAYARTADATMRKIGCYD